MRWRNRSVNNGQAIYKPVLNEDNQTGPPQLIDGTALWIKNTSPYPQEKLEPMLLFAFSDVIDYGIEIHLKGSSSSFRGRAYDGVPHFANVVDGAHYLVTIGLARSRALLPKTIDPMTKSVQKEHPQGVKVRDWEDIFIYVAAHEARHIWQFNARRESGKQPISEVDAEKYAIERLTDWVANPGQPAFGQ